MDASNDESLADKQEQLAITESADDYYEEEPDESLSERIWGLTEMFPEPIRDVTETLVTLTEKGITGFYKFACSASWIFFTTSMILFAPVIFETERAQMEEMQKSQQKQVLLGPGSAGLPPHQPPMPR